MNVRETLPNNFHETIARCRQITRAAGRVETSAEPVDICETGALWRGYESRRVERLHQGGFCDDAGGCAAPLRLVGALRGVFGRRHQDFGITYFGKLIQPEAQPDLAGLWGFEEIGCVPRKTPFITRDTSGRFVLGYDVCTLLPFGNDKQVAVWDTHRPRHGSFLLPVWTSSVSSQPARLGIRVCQDSKQIQAAVQYWDGTLVVHTLDASKPRH